MKKIKVAMADDNRDLVGLMQEHIDLQDNMEVVATAYNGKACLEIIEKEEIDVLLLDVIMPYVDGIAILDAIKENAESKDIHVIMLSAFGQEAIMQRAAANGASYFLMKPFEMDHLVSQINHFVGAGGHEPDELSDVVLQMMREVGIPPHIKGFVYLKEAIHLVYGDDSLLSRVTKELYPEIAKRFDTTATRVERSIRHAIELVWKNIEVTDLSASLGYSEQQLSAKPSNSQFIAMVVERVRERV